MMAPGNIIPFLALLLIQSSTICAVLIFLRHHPQLSNLPLAWILSLYGLSCLVHCLPAMRRRHPLLRQAISATAAIAGTALLLKTQLYAASPWSDLAVAEGSGKRLLLRVFRPDAGIRDGSGLRGMLADCRPCRTATR